MTFLSGRGAEGEAPILLDGGICSRFSVRGPLRSSFLSTPWISHFLFYTTFSLQGVYVGIAYGKKEIEDSLSMIANILEAFDLSKKEWAK